MLKQKIGNREYNFKMTNKTIRKIDEKYGNYGSVIYGLMEGQQFYTNALKLVSLCCVNTDKEGNLKEFDIEELEDLLTGEQYQEITGLAIELYLNYMGMNEYKKSRENGKKEKN